MRVLKAPHKNKTKSTGSRLPFARFLSLTDHRGQRGGYKLLSRPRNDSTAPICRPNLPRERSHERRRHGLLSELSNETRSGEYRRSENDGLVFPVGQQRVKDMLGGIEATYLMDKSSTVVRREHGVPPCEVGGKVPANSPCACGDGKTRWPRAPGLERGTESERLCLRVKVREKKKKNLSSSSCPSGALSSDTFPVQEHGSDPAPEKKEEEKSTARRRREIKTKKSGELGAAQTLPPDCFHPKSCIKYSLTSVHPPIPPPPPSPESLVL